MHTTTRITLLLATIGLAMVLAGCGTLRAGDQGGDRPASTCLAGDPDCQDIPGTTGPAVAPPASGAVPVADAAGIEGPFAMTGYYVDDGSGPWLCEALAESFPPQCGGASVRLDPGGFPVAGLESSQGVTWSNEPVVIEGEFSFGVFMALVAE